MSRYAAIVLAAGFSSRMEQFKPLLTIGDETMTDRVISLFTRNEIDVFLVVGWQKEKLFAGIKNKDVRIIENPDFPDGTFTSVKAGVRNLGTGYKGFFVLPVDVPLVRPFTILCLLKKFQEQPEKIIYPVCNKMRGHPPIMPTSIIPDIMDWNSDGGLKAVLKKHENIAMEINVPDIYILFDLDTYYDYEIALERFKRYDIPTEEECEAILDICNVDPARRCHCDKVAEIAGCISRALYKSGHEINQELIRAAASLHDIVREQSKHDETGGYLLKDMGFGRVGDIVAVHTFLHGEIEAHSLESRVVYLADKFVQGDCVVSLEARFQASKYHFGVTPEIKEKIEQRMQRAYKVKLGLEILIGYPLESIL